MIGAHGSAPVALTARTMYTSRLVDRTRAFDRRLAGDRPAEDLSGSPPVLHSGRRPDTSSAASSGRLVFFIGGQQ